MCNKIPVQIIKHVPKTVTKKICVSTKPSGYGHVDAGYSSQSEHHGGYSENVFTFIAAPPGGNNGTAATVAISTGSSNSTSGSVGAAPGLEPRVELDEVEPEVYYDEVEESDYLNEEVN